MRRSFRDRARTLASTPRGQLLLWVLVVGASLSFLLPSTSVYHGDEALYTDAAIRMVQTGDYWTPRFSDGRQRFQKPILTYWTIVASYKAFGVNLMSSRLPSLIAGGGIILLTWQLSMTLFRRPSEATLAALIAGSNSQILTLAIRSTPDALVTLLLLLSLLGFARIVIARERSWGNYAMAYVGAGLAVQVKGLLGLAAVAFAVAYCLLFDRQRTRLRALVEWKAVALGLLIALFWHIGALVLHGRTVIDTLLQDQVTRKVSLNPLIALRNLAAYIGAAVRHFLPWTVLLAAALAVGWRDAVGRLRAQGRESLFLGAWFVLFSGVFAFSTMTRTRFIVPSYPGVAVLSAAVLMRCADGARFAGFARTAGKVLTLGMLAIGLLLVAAGLALDVRMAIAGLGVFVVSAATLAALRRHDPRPPWAAVAAVALLFFVAHHLGVRPVFSRSPAAAIVARLRAAVGLGCAVQALNIPGDYQAQVRVLAGGRIDLLPLVPGESGRSLDPAQPVILPEGDLGLLDQSWTVTPAGSANGDWRLKDILRLLATRSKDAEFARYATWYYLALPRTPAVEPQRR